MRFKLLVAIAVLGLNLLPFAVATAQVNSAPGTVGKCFDGTEPDTDGTCPPPPNAYSPKPAICVNDKFVVIKFSTSGQCSGTVYPAVRDNTGNTNTGTGTNNQQSGSGSGNTTGKDFDCDPAYNKTVNGLCLPKNPLGDNLTGVAGSGNITELIARVIQILLYFAGVVAVIFIIIGGYRYMTAGGNSETAGKGRATMVNAIIGLVAVILAYVVITAVTNFLIR